MKLLLLATLLLTAPAWASERVLPANISCEPLQAQHAKAFDILNLNTEETRSTLPDTSLLERFVDPGTYRVSFSNECDNAYSITFFTTDLEALAAGAVREVTGLMNYFNADFETESSETVVISCHTKRQTSSL